MKVAGRTNLYGLPRAGIRFNNRIFTEPVPFALAIPPVSSGIYAILVADALCRPRPFRAIYFGESGNFLDRVTERHEHFDDWTRESGGLDNIFVAFCPTPLLKEKQRRWVESDLIVQYRPVCNLKDNQPPLAYQSLVGIAK
jgi:hypothetical protein